MCFKGVTLTATSVCAGPKVITKGWTLVDEVKNGVGDFLRKYWFLITAAIILAGDFAVGQYRLQQNDAAIKELENRINVALAPEKYAEYGELKRTVQHLQDEVQELEDELRRLR